jgi:hypothetical protein
MFSAIAIAVMFAASGIDAVPQPHIVYYLVDDLGYANVRHR